MFQDSKIITGVVEFSYSVILFWIKMVLNYDFDKIQYGYSMKNIPTPPRNFFFQTFPFIWFQMKASLKHKIFQFSHLNQYLLCNVIPKPELQRIVNMDRIPNIFVFENLTNTEYRIIHFLKIDLILNINCSIWTQLFEYQILNNEYWN